jgi:hypothetical protein
VNGEWGGGGAAFGKFNVYKTLYSKIIWLNDKIVSIFTAKIISLWQ